MTSAAIDASSVSALCTALDLVPSPVQVEALLRYLQLLQRWNATYNLTAVRDPAAMLTQHLADCLAVVGPLRRQLEHMKGDRHAAAPATQRLLDVGSGGGLPAVVIAALAPDVSVTSVDAVGKKVAFVRQVSGALPLPNLRGVHARVEQLATAPFNIITSRAFASLADFVRLTKQHLAPGGVWMAMKGKAPVQEIAEVPSTIEVFHVEQLQVPGLDAERCLVWMHLR